MLLPEFGVKRPVTNLMIFLVFIIMGLVSLHFLSIDLMPEIEPPVISVSTYYPGAGAEDVESKVTKIVENDLSILTNLDELISFSREESSIVACYFNWGTNLDEAANEIRERLDFTKKKLPDDVEKPTIFKFSTSMIPVLVFAVTAKENWERLRTIIDDEIADDLKRLEGVGTVFSFGGLERQVNVELDRVKLNAHHLSVNDIERALQGSNLNTPAGSLKIGRNEYILRMVGEYARVSEIAETVIKEHEGSLIRLKDLAKIEDRFKEETGVSYIDGQRGIMLIVQKQSGANTVKVSQAVLNRLEELKRKLPPDIRIVPLMDNAEFIQLAITNLQNTLIFGGILVILVALFFLRDFRSSLIIALTIPFSLIVAFVFIYLFGMTLNTMTLGSLVIAIGMVVDNAVVVIDNISRHLTTGKKPVEGSLTPRLAASILGASEVGLAVSASTFTTIVVFVPLIFVTGITGIIFKELGLVVCITLLASLGTALTFSPMLASRLLKAKDNEDKPRCLPGTNGRQRPLWSLRLWNRFYQWSGNIFNRVELCYQNLIGWALGHRGLVIILAVAIFALSLGLVPFIGTEFFPEEDAGFVTLTLELPVGARLEETMRVWQEIEKICYAEASQELNHVGVRAGTMGGMGAMTGMKEQSNILWVRLRLKKINERTRSSKEIAQIIKNKIAKVPGVVKTSADTGHPMQMMMMGGGKPLSIEIMGNDIPATNQVANEVLTIMKETTGVMDPTISRDVAKPELRVKINADKAGALGLTKAQIGDTLRTYFYGKNITKYREAGDEYDIFLRLQPEDRNFIQDIKDITIPSITGQSVPLINVALVEEGLAPLEIERKNQERIIRVESNIYNRSLGEVTNDIESRLAGLAIPEGVSLKMGGLVKEQRQSFKDLQILLLLAIVLVYMVMASQFENLIYPLIIMFSVPFAFTGVFWALFMGGYTISLVSLIGAILLVGIVVNNAIVMVDYINLLRRNYGLPTLEAIKQGAQRRLRPILITSLTTIFGLLPLAFATGEGSEGWRPLGLTIAVGLLVSMLVTLILIPTIYSLMTRRGQAEASP